MSSTLSDTGPLAPLGESQPVAAQAPPAPATAPARSRPHIVAFDMIRLIIMVFVVGVHTLAWGGGQVTVALGAVSTVFHTSRELFLLLTALVLTYNYGHRARLNTLKFWRRRYWLVVPAYVTWSAIYYAADGSGRGPFPSAFLHDLLNSGARYHLYFLLVSMQIYLLFPLLRWVLSKTEGYHQWLLAAAVAYQLWLSLALHYHLGRPASGGLAEFLNAAGQGYWVDTYVLYVVAGAIAGWHFDELCAFTRRHLGTVGRIALVAAVGVIVGLGTYLIEIYSFGATPSNASAVFQPVVILEALTLGWALLAAGLLWSDRGAPHRKFAAAGSASSFGIYLAHPLVLQGLLLVTGASFLGPHGGWLGAIRRAPDGLTVVVLLFVAVPIIYAIAWLIASAARRTPASLMLTGREYRAKKEGSGVTPRGRGKMIGRFLILITAFVATLSGATFAGVHIISAIERPTTTTMYSMKVGSLTRQYEVIAPTAALPKSAPIIVMLQGAAVVTSQEITRDQMVPYANADKAEIVYPVAMKESWNAIGCCDGASKENINDVGFIKALVPKLDPGRTRPIYVVGYSVGGRLAYRLACTDPGLFDGMAAVKADPMPGCVVTKPMNVIVFSSMNDKYVPYKLGEKGFETPPATVQIARLEKDLRCSSKPTKVKHGPMTVSTWSCADGKTLQWAVSPSGGHDFPDIKDGASANQLIYSFITKTPLAPVPS